MGQFVMQIGLGMFLLGLLRFAVATGDPGLPTAIAGFEKWAQVAKVSDTGGPHPGQNKTVFASPIAAKAWKAKGALPVGSIIVKTAGAVTAPSLVAVMNKTSTGWVYEEFTPKDGKYTLFARGSLCSNCHEGAKAKDFLFTR